MARTVKYDWPVKTPKWIYFFSASTFVLAFVPWAGLLNILVLLAFPIWGFLLLSTRRSGPLVPFIFINAAIAIVMFFVYFNLGALGF